MGIGVWGSMSAGLTRTDTHTNCGGTKNTSIAVTVVSGEVTQAPSENSDVPQNLKVAVTKGGG